MNRRESRALSVLFGITPSQESRAAESVRGCHIQMRRYICTHVYKHVCIGRGDSALLSCRFALFVRGTRTLLTDPRLRNRVPPPPKKNRTKKKKQGPQKGLASTLAHASARRSRQSAVPCRKRIRPMQKRRSSKRPKRRGLSAHACLTYQTFASRDVPRRSHPERLACRAIRKPPPKRDNPREVHKTDNRSKPNQREGNAKKANKALPSWTPAQAGALKPGGGSCPQQIGYRGRTNKGHSDIKNKKKTIGEK